MSAPSPGSPRTPGSTPYGRWTTFCCGRYSPPRRRKGSGTRWTLLAALAGVTSRIRLGTLVSCTGYRNPVVLANMAATLDEASGGRLVLGLGAGNDEEEHRALGVPIDHRIGRFEEALAIITALLRRGEVDFTGDVAHGARRRSAIARARGRAAPRC